MAKRLGLMLPILAAFLFMGLCITPAFAAKPVRAESPIIISVQHSYDPDELIINGQNLAEDGLTLPIVTLDGAELTVVDWSPTKIKATPTSSFPEPGDYELLLDSTLRGTEAARMWVTLGAVGPQGPQGSPGTDLSAQMAELAARLDTLKAKVDVNHPYCVAAPEICDELDNDCNGLVDDGLICNSDSRRGACDGLPGGTSGPYCRETEPLASCDRFNGTFLISNICPPGSNTNLDCSGNEDGTKEYDRCGICGGDGTSCLPPPP